MSTKTIARARGGWLMLAVLALGCGGDDWHDLSPLRHDCGQSGGTCCDGFACYNGGRCFGSPATCHDPERRQRNECRSDNDCGLSEQCGGAQSCLEERVCFLCQAAFAGATAQLGQPCSGHQSCTTGMCFGGLCSAPCRYDGGDAACQALPNGANFYCASVRAIYVGASSPITTTVSICQRRCNNDGTCPSGQVCFQQDEALLSRITPTCVLPRS